MTAAVLLGGLLSLGLSELFAGLGQWVGDGAVWLLSMVGDLMTSTTSVNLGGAWFDSQQQQMAEIAAALALPLVCCAVIQSLWRQSPGMLVKSVLVNMPLALVGGGIVIWLVQAAMAVTDQLSDTVLGSGRSSVVTLVAAITNAMGAAAGVPSFVLFIIGLLVAVACLVLWLELAVRSAMIAALVLFLPLVMAATIWPAIAHWCRRLLEAIAAVVLSKFVIAAILALGVGALGGALGSGGGLSAVVVGLVLLILAGFSPFILLRAIPIADSAAVGSLEGARQRLVRPVASGSTAAGRMLDMVDKYGGSGRAAAAAAAAAGLDVSAQNAPGDGSADQGGGSGSGDASGGGSVSGSGGEVSGGGAGSVSGSGGEVSGGGAGSDGSGSGEPERPWPEGSPVARRIMSEGLNDSRDLADSKAEAT